LRFALLDIMLVLVVVDCFPARRTYRRRLVGQGLAARLLLVFSFPALAPAFVVVLIVVHTLALLVQVFSVVSGRVSRERTDHVAIGVIEIEAVVTVEVVYEWRFIDTCAAKCVCWRALLGRREEGGVHAVARVVELRIVRGASVVDARGEHVVGVLVVGRESGEEEILRDAGSVHSRALACDSCAYHPPAESNQGRRGPFQPSQEGGSGSKRHEMLSTKTSNCTVDGCCECDADCRYAGYWTDAFSERVVRCNCVEAEGRCRVCRGGLRSAGGRGDAVRWDDTLKALVLSGQERCAHGRSQ
jgi:hypothetical protein